jgi:hypothetical protein
METYMSMLRTETNTSSHDNKTSSSQKDKNKKILSSQQNINNKK